MVSPNGSPYPSSENSKDLYSLESNDPRGELFDRSSIDGSVLEQLGRLMNAMGHLREVERSLAQASKEYMKLGETDMRAIQFIITQTSRHIGASPSALAAHLGITTASTTKLLDRLENGGHIRRNPNPDDRRALIITVSESTRAAAMSSIGRFQSARIAPALALTAAEREVVIKFLGETADAIQLAIEANPLPAADA